MTGQIKTEGFFLKCQELFLIPFTNFRQCRGIDTGLIILEVEEPHLWIVAFALDPLTVIQGAFEGGQHLRSFGPGRVKCTAFDQTLDNPFVDLF